MQALIAHGAAARGEPDAAYVALAEAAGCPLLTADNRLQRAAGARCEIEVL